MLKLAIIVCIIAQALSAPSGCLDLCGPPSTIHLPNEALRDLHNLTDELKRDYNRPGNWTEHNDYKTHDGAGEVHEERGQVVKGNSKMRYYKKNYTASYGRQNSYNDHYHQSGRSSKIEDYNGRTDTSSVHESAGVKGHVGSDNWSRHNSYVTDGGHGRVYEEEGQYTHGPAKVNYYKKNYTSSYSSSDASPIIPLPDMSTDLHTQAYNLHKQLEELSREVHRGHHSQMSQNTNNYETQYQNTRDNESRHNSRIESDIHQRYPSPTTGAREEHYEQHSSRREHRVQSHGSYVPSQTNYVIPDQMQTSESQQHYQQEIYRPTSQVIPQTSQTYQTQGHQYQAHGQEYQSQAQYQNQYRSQDHRSSDGLIHVPLSSGNDYNSDRDDSRIYTQHQQVRDHSGLSQSYLDNDRSHQNSYGHHGRQQQISSQSGKRLEENWSSSGHRVEESYPQHISSSSQKLEDLETQHATRGNEDSYGSSSHYGGNRYLSGSSSSYHQRYESHSGGHSGHNGHFHTGVLDLGHDTPDCDTEQVGSNYQRRYKRNSESFNKQLPQKSIEQSERKTRSTDFGQETQQFEDLTQLTQGFADYTQQQPTGYLNPDDQQQTEDLELSQQTQQVEDLTQKYGNYDQQQPNQGYGSYRQQQQTSGHLGHDQHQSGNLASNPQTQQNRESIHQTQRHGNHGQHSGQLEVGNQHQRHHIEDSQLSQQTQQVEDLTQQTQRHGGYRQHDYSGRSNQQQVGNLELNQQNRQVKDLTQQTQRHGGYRQQEYGGRSSQQQVGNLELSQETQQVEDLTQQTYDDYYQRHSGKLELDEHQQHQQTENLSQQTQKFDDYYQQQSGSHRLDQNQYGQSTGIGLNQQTEDFNQHDDHYYPSQQTAGNTEYGQQNIHSQVSQPAPKPISRHHLLGSTQRSDIELDNYPGYGSGQEIRPANRPMGVKGGRGGFNPQPSYPNQYDSSSSSVLSLEDQQYQTRSGELNAHVESLEPQTQYPEFMSTTPAPGFWKKVGQKITTGFEKVKAKVNDAFG
ncbi:filaggrin-2-like [Chelonus insularis]|uniref:filaggrin-2-like n=1 Tax=Chelonus insularis TaxID=460826 RepID=UPI00158E837F|nr:filaggrin-2-like [Chelonus insularis]